MQLVGEIELASERGHPHEFVSLVRDLSPGGDLLTTQTFSFEFRSVEMEYESYKGSQVRLRYLLRVTVVRGLGQTVTKEYPFWVRNRNQLTSSSSSSGDDAKNAASGGASASGGGVLSEPGTPIKMEVGIEDCLHIEFEYDRSSYDLQDTVVGKIYFLLVRIKLKHMELEIRRKETVGGGATARVETETVAKYEIMDGAPVRGEIIPIRLHLAPYDLTPTYPNVHNKFGVKYSINLVLVDEEDRRYFKQQEITLVRGAEGHEKKKKMWGRKELESGGTSNCGGGGGEKGAPGGAFSRFPPGSEKVEVVVSEETKTGGEEEFEKELEEEERESPPTTGTTPVDENEEEGVVAADAAAASLPPL